ncbi:MAG: hypothetical protein JSS25_08880 [Proteobacteria bacterium]|nr:hypothetical protein [Pseudomonadota bacterium]
MRQNASAATPSGATAGILILVAAAMGAIDLAIAAIYWNLPLDRILRSVARWFVDVRTMAPLAAAMAGAVVQLAMMLLMILGALPLGRLLESERASLRIAMLGALYGGAFYIFQFHILLPLFHPLPDLGLRWELACFADYALLLGPCALTLVHLLAWPSPTHRGHTVVAPA